LEVDCHEQKESIDECKNDVEGAGSKSSVLDVVGEKNQQDK